MLYVPRHWWHYVESVDPITVSVNSWIELVRIQIHPEDDEGHSAASDMKTFTACIQSLGQSKALLPVAFVQQLMLLVPVSHLPGRRRPDESQRGCDQGCRGRPKSCTEC